jgi:hypothetical protein
MAGLWPAGWAPAAPPSVAAPVSAPLILTVALPDALQRKADAIRSARTPEAAARAPAHLTLFRHLPGPEAQALLRTLKAYGASPAPVFRLRPPARWNGLWVAPVESPALDELRAALAHDWHGLLAPGDLAPPRLHISLGTGSAAPPLLPEGPWAARGLLLWRHGSPLPGPIAQRDGVQSVAQRDGPKSVAQRDGSFWTPLVATAFRG